MRKMIKVFLKFASHIEESDINNTVEKMKKGIEGIKESVYPFAKVDRIDDMKYDVYVNSRMAVLHFIDEKTNAILFTRSVYFKEVDGEIRITLLPTFGGAVSFDGDGVPISEAFELDIKEVKKTDRVTGALRPNGFIDLYPIVLVRCVAGNEEERKD